MARRVVDSAIRSASQRIARRLILLFALHSGDAWSPAHERHPNERGTICAPVLGTKDFTVLALVGIALRS